MKCNALIQEVFLCCGYEGEMLLDINGIQFRVYYQDNDEYIESNILGPGYKASKSGMILKWDERSGYGLKKIEVDLSLIYGKLKKITENKKELGISKQSAGAKIKGQVISVISPEELRVDCGLLTIDIKNEGNIKDVVTGDFIETEGTCFISLGDF